DDRPAVDHQFAGCHVDLEHRLIAVIETPRSRFGVELAGDLRRLFPRALVARPHRVTRVATMRRYHHAKINVGLAVLERRRQAPHAIVDRRLRAFALRATEHDAESDSIAAAKLVESRRTRHERIDLQTP